MLTQEDIKLMEKAFATKADLEVFKESILEALSDLHGSVDAYAKKSRYLFSGDGNVVA